MGALHEFFVQMRLFVIHWWPLLIVTFYVALLYLFWRILQVMPRVKPVPVDANEHTAIGWDEIAGADEAKAELLEIVEFLRDPERFERLGAHVPEGVLLYGPPGARKTLVAEAAGHPARAKLHYP